MKNTLIAVKFLLTNAKAIFETYSLHSLVNKLLRME